MNDENALQSLQTLRDIHLPDAVSIWPLATGWYIVLVLFLIFAVTAWFYFRHLQTPKRKYGLMALKELERIRYEKNNIAALSVLLRRTALAIYPRQDVAGLQGEAWLQFLDKTAQTTAFTEGPGHALITGPYQQQRTVKQNAVFALAEAWIKQVCK